MPPDKLQPSPEKLHRAHDAFVKKAFSRNGLLLALLRAVAPETAAVLAEQPFRAVEKAFIDRHLKSTEADFIRVVKLKNGGSAYLLAEHKSTPDPRTHRQIAGYCLGLCNMHQERGGGEPPTIIPLVIYHGEEPFALPEDLAKPAVPGAAAPLSCRPILCNLRELPPDALRGHPLLQAVVDLLLLDREKEVSREELAAVLAGFESDEELLVAGMSYIIARCNVSSSVAHAAMLDVKLRGGNDVVGVIAQEYFDNGVEEGFKQGVAEGEANGIAKGKAEGLIRQLGHRFGRDLPDWALARVKGASVEALDAWAVRVLNAQSLEAVLRD